jgi:hypothetical protein
LAPLKLAGKSVGWLAMEEVAASGDLVVDRARA